MQGLIKPRFFLFLGDPDRPPCADDLEDDDGHNEGVDRHDDHAEELHEELMDAGVINDKERSIFAAYQISGSAPLTNYFSSAVAIFPVLLVPIIVPLLVILLFKLIGGNIVRIYLNLIEKKQGGAVNE